MLVMAVVAVVVFSILHLTPGDAAAIFDWPDVTEIERLCVEFSRAPDEAARKKLAHEIQQLVIDEGVLLPMGQMSYLSAWRSNVIGLL